MYVCCLIVSLFFGSITVNKSIFKSILCVFYSLWYCIFYGDCLDSNALFFLSRLNFFRALFFFFFLSFFFQLSIMETSCLEKAFNAIEEASVTLESRSIIDRQFPDLTQTFSSTTKNNLQSYKYLSFLYRSLCI